MGKENVTFRLDRQKRATLEAIASGSDRNLSYILNEAVSLYLEIHQWQIEEICRSLAEADTGDFASDAEVEATFKKLTHAD